MALVLCKGAGGSYPLAHDEWGGRLPYRENASIERKSSRELTEPLYQRHDKRSALNFYALVKAVKSQPVFIKNGVCSGILGLTVVRFGVVP